MNIKKILVSSAAGALMFGSLAVGAFASTDVYNALPSVSPSINYPSQPFQAQQTFEFGDYIHLGGTARVLNTVTVTMSDWAKYSDYIGDSRYVGNPTSWTHPITLNVYTNHLGTNGAPDQKIATVTQNITIPWRPESDPSCGSTSNGTGWKEGDTCYDYSGIAFNATFDLSTLNVTLPNDIIVSVAFNTQTWGYTPIGQSGPYNSLNVVVKPNQSVLSGTDDSNTEVFWNTHTCNWYTDSTSKATCSGGTYGLFRDTGWIGYPTALDTIGTVALRVTANLSSPTNKDQCKNNGWKNYADQNGNPFKNQGDCVSYVATRYKTFTASDSLYYNCPVVCESLYGTGAITFTWDKVTGNVTSGKWDEVVPPTTGTTYYNIVTAGTVSGNNVNLTFDRTNPDVNHFTFTGTLVDNVLTGQMAGPYYFTATGN